MTKGKWILTCLDYDSMENHDPISETWMWLQAKTEEEALIEARKVWNSLPKYAGHSYGHSGVLVQYPRRPRLIYLVEILL